MGRRVRDLRGVKDLGVGVWGWGLMFKSLGGLGCRGFVGFRGVGFGILGSRFGVERVGTSQGLGLNVQEFRGLGEGFRM